MAGEGAGATGPVRKPKSAEVPDDVRRCRWLPEDLRASELLRRLPDPPRLPPDNRLSARRGLPVLTRGPLLLKLPVLCSLLVRARLPDMESPILPDPRRLERLREASVERVESLDLVRSLLIDAAVRNAPETGSLSFFIVLLALVDFVPPRPELTLSWLPLLGLLD